MSDSKLDAKGMKCPKPLFEVHKSVKQLDIGQVLEVQADDPAFKLDIEAWCRRTGHDLMSLEKQSGVFHAQIRKMK